ncbi:MULTISPECIES: helix-turn-helix transcriptional regulator [unclassified Streptomyces]|uniref:helix-turn-helix domain-containing protein n=1 Tax=unclassified Streptomyces TaxID=2593676 RepID=UPI002259149A|nr:MULTISPECIES: helix-turn-helix transcriptional regulator [unclassified Streptomyces]MCX4524617.1 helix-turn-helix domain-containing protein [Streptomyces sp. NBC_01551]MCX4544859.1 helix-turn-helix domain-containing protein [Streptomyces sp. NBC_01565]
MIPPASGVPAERATGAALFGARLSRLIELRYPDGGARYLDVEIAAGTRISQQHVANLRNGKSVPGLDRALSLAAFFRLDGVDYFVRPETHPAVAAVERRLLALESARASGLPAAPCPAGGAPAAHPLGLPGPADAEETRAAHDADEVDRLRRRCRDSGAALATAGRSAGVSVRDKATAATLLGLVESILRPGTGGR